MIFLSVIVLPAIAAFFAMVLIGLIGLPLRPKSKVFAAVWILSLVGIAAILLMPAQGVQWYPPAWHSGVSIAALFIPYTISGLFWYRRRNRFSNLGATTIVFAVLVSAVLSLGAYRWFNKSCVFHDYHHDEGEAWCPENWQAVYTNR